MRPRRENTETRPKLTPEEESLLEEAATLRYAGRTWRCGPCWLGLRSYPRPSKLPVHRFFKFVADWSDWFELIPVVVVVGMVAFVLVVGRWE